MWPLAAISADDAVKVAQAAQDLLRKDFYSAAFVLMGAAILGLVAWVVWLQVRLTWVQEKRVDDHVQGEQRYRAQADRMALHMERTTQMGAHVMYATDELLRAKGRRPAAPAALLPPPAELAK